MQQLHNRLHAAKKKHVDSIDKLEKSKKIIGPCSSSIEPVLQWIGISRQAYHGGAFVGNHVHRALQQDATSAIVSAPAGVVQERQLALSHKAEVIQQRYQVLLSSYAACRALYNHSRPINDCEIEKLEKAIGKFLSLCRSQIVERQLGHMTPKLHLLEEHTVPAIRQFRVGLALLAEQGSESIHARFNDLQANFHSIRGDMLRLNAVAKQHLVNTLPEHDALKPGAKKKLKQ